MSNPTTGEHHPSCRESDKDLVWHCSQCGLNESAADIEEQLAAEREKREQAEKESTIFHQDKLRLIDEREKDFVRGTCGASASSPDNKLAAAVEALKAIRKHAEGENYKRCLGCSFTFNSADAALAKIGEKP